MVVRIKICGITTQEAAVAAGDLGADAVGFVFAESPRRVTIGTALALARDVSLLVTRVAVFRLPDPSWVKEVVSTFRPDVIQVEPSPDLKDAMGEGSRLLPVFHDSPALADHLAAGLHTGSAMLLEGPGRGGRGEAPSWERAARAAGTHRLVLAGGLSPANVRDAILAVRPYGVDVSSGVESSMGVKDPNLIAQFIAATRQAEREMTSLSDSAA